MYQGFIMPDLFGTQPRAHKVSQTIFRVVGWKSSLSTGTHSVGNCQQDMENGQKGNPPTRREETVLMDWIQPIVVIVNIYS